MGFFTDMINAMGFSKDADAPEVARDEDEIQDEEDEEDSGFRNPFSGLFGGRGRWRAEDDEEPQAEPEPQPRRAKAARDNVIHDARMDSRAEGQSQREAEYVHCERIVTVRQIEQCRQLIQYLLQGESVLLNLEYVDPKDCVRVVDLLSGASFALNGHMLKVAHLAYLLAPNEVLVIEDDKYNQGNMGYGRQ